MDIDILHEIRETLIRLGKDISGNGQPGLRQRIESLEDSKNKIIGGAAVTGVVGTIIWGLLEYIFHFKRGG